MVSNEREIAQRLGLDPDALPPGEATRALQELPRTPRRLLKVTTSNSYTYDPGRVQALYEQLQPDPDQYGDDPAYAVWAYLHDSLYGADVFDDQGDFDQGYEDEEYQPDA